MKKTKVDITIFSLSLVAALVLIGTAFKEHFDSKRTPQELIGGIQESLSAAKDKVSEAQAQVRDLQAAIKPFQNTSSPIKVRGGSMTAFTKVSNGWVSNDSGVTFCVLVDDVTYIAYNGDPLKDAAGSDIASVSTPWDLLLTGNIPDNYGSDVRGTDSKNGFKLHGDKTDCNKNPVHNGNHGSITLSLLGGNNADYYPIALPKGKKDGKRFWDKSQMCMGEPDSHGKGDREFCERMDWVSLAAYGTTIPQAQCADGDCEIWIGGVPK